MDPTARIDVVDDARSDARKSALCFSLSWTLYNRIQAWEMHRSVVTRPCTTNGEASSYAASKNACRSYKGVPLGAPDVLVLFLALFSLSFSFAGDLWSPFALL